MNIFLTGSSGFIGSNLIKISKLFTNCNLKVHSRSIFDNNAHVEHIICKFNEISTVDIKDCDVIVHCASVGVKNNNTSLLECIEFNYYETLKFLNKAYYSGCKKWIILGTSSEYGLTLKKKASRYI